MTNEEFNELLRERTMKYAIRIFNLVNEIPFNTAIKIISYQLGKSASSVGTNFRTFCRGRSKAEIFSKICIVIEEAEECKYWLEILLALEYGDRKELFLQSHIFLNYEKILLPLQSRSFKSQRQYPEVSTYR